ncbi:unnamed protein product [Lathyrus sativus]|nr:unnamed protein product [Lathyrus sativus]
MARATGLFPLFSTTMIIMIILFLSLEKAIGEDAKMDTAKYFTRGAWVPPNCPVSEILKPCTDNFIGACVHGVDDACCDSICKHSGIDKGGFCKPLPYKQPPPHDFCHCYC